MKEKQLELLEKVKNGTLTPIQAQKQLLGLFSVIGRYVSELEIEYKHPSGKVKGRLMYEDDEGEYLILKQHGSSYITLPHLDKCKVVNAL